LGRPGEETPPEGGVIQAGIGLGAVEPLGMANEHFGEGHHIKQARASLQRSTVDAVQRCDGIAKALFIHATKL